MGFKADFCIINMIVGLFMFAFCQRIFAYSYPYLSFLDSSFPSFNSLARTFFQSFLFNPTSPTLPPYSETIMKLSYGFNEIVHLHANA
jgi:hypothetical protein